MDSKNLKYLIPSIIFLILSAFGIIYIINHNKSVSNPDIIAIVTPTIAPTPTIIALPTVSITPIATNSSIKEKSNLLKISDIQITFPESWKVVSSTEKTAKILTDYKQYQVYLILNFEKNTTNAKNSYDTEGKTNAIKTQYGEVYSISSGGGAGMTGALLNNNKYLFKWDIESNQKPPTVLDGVWKADSNITQKSLLDITKTVQSLTKITPTATPSASPTPKVTTTPILTPTPSTIDDLTSTISTTPTPTPTELTFSSSTDGFSIIYNSYRKLYQDKETSGNRYTFYSNSGNFAVHVGLNNQWAWTTPNRNFSGNLVISGQNTYRYDTDAQTIVDIQYNSKNYTLQCIHNGKATLKAECETFLKSFKLL